jgi:hypothetical protein
VGLRLENCTCRPPNLVSSTAFGRPDCGLVAESGTVIGVGDVGGFQKKNCIGLAYGQFVVGVGRVGISVYFSAV